MTNCEVDKQELVAYLLGELDDEDARSLDRHVEGCPACRRDAEELKLVLNGAAAAHRRAEAAMATVDWEALPERIARKVFDRAREAEETLPRGAWKAVFALRPVAAGLAAGLILGGLVVYLLIRPSPPQPGGASSLLGANDVRFSRLMDRREAPGRKRMGIRSPDGAARHPIYSPPSALPAVSSPVPAHHMCALRVRAFDANQPRGFLRRLNLHGYIFLWSCLHCHNIVDGWQGR